MIDEMKPQELFNLLDELNVDNKLVNHLMIIYPDNYDIGDGTYICVAILSEEDEDGCYTTAKFSEDFEQYPCSLEEFSEWLNEFKSTGKMPNFTY